jgi:peroxiredoxin
MKRGTPATLLIWAVAAASLAQLGAAVLSQPALSRIPADGMPPMGPNDPTVPAGTRAPDGIGVVVDRSPGAGPLSVGFWEPDSLATPLVAGTQMPVPAIVKDLDGKPFDLNAAVSRRPAVLIFYRGGWCPYCNAHLRELQRSAPTLQKMGYQILAVSTDTPQELRATLERDQIKYTLLSDDQVAVAATFGLRYKVAKSYLAHVRDDKGVDLEKRNGGYLLTPAAYIVDRTGKLRFAYVNQNASVRVGQDVLLRAAQAALQ